MPMTFRTLVLPIAAAATLLACGGKPPAGQEPGSAAGAAAGPGADAASAMPGNAAVGYGPAGNAPSGNAPSGNAEEKVLNVYNWSDFIDPTVLEGFTRETGIKINYDVYDSNEVLQTKILTGRTGYDIVVPSASFLERQIKAGAIRKLDKAQLPNLRNLDPEITRLIAQHDPGNEHSVNYMWGTSGVGYNAARIRERMPDAPVDSFAMFYDPKVVARFKDCGVTLLDAPSEVVGTVLIYLGKDANSEKPEDLAAAEKVLMSIRPFIKYVNSSKYIDDLANGEVCLALGWSGDVLQSRERSAAAGTGIEVKYLIPKEGAVMFFDMLAVPADAKHPRNAHLFIDYLLRPEIAARNSNFVKYANSNAASLPLVSEALRNDRGVYPSAELKPRLVPDFAKTTPFTRVLNRTWTRFKTGK
jgi:putrescine transport system substrate-binding protein